mmetsp:Transcript_35759/g.39816  ORF Transcript_35759/g.39816 Transcript_35759/m.39816 type:complete len:204 (+) Transcript_35759:547-1158(+)
MDEIIRTKTIIPKPILDVFDLTRDIPIISLVTRFLRRPGPTLLGTFVFVPTLFRTFGFVPALLAGPFPIRFDLETAGMCFPGLPYFIDSPITHNTVSLDGTRHGIRILHHRTCQIHGIHLTITMIVHVTILIIMDQSMVRHEFDTFASPGKTTNPGHGINHFHIAIPTRITINTIIGTGFGKSLVGITHAMKETMIQQQDLHL